MLGQRTVAVKVVRNVATVSAVPTVVRSGQNTVLNRVAVASPDAPTSHVVTSAYLDHVNSQLAVMDPAAVARLLTLEFRVLELHAAVVVIRASTVPVEVESRTANCYPYVRERRAPTVIRVVPLAFRASKPAALARVNAARG